jgi:hypothetical protein
LICVIYSIVWSGFPCLCIDLLQYLVPLQTKSIVPMQFRVMWCSMRFFELFAWKHWKQAWNRSLVFMWQSELLLMSKKTSWTTIFAAYLWCTTSIAALSCMWLHFYMPPLVVTNQCLTTLSCNSSEVCASVWGSCWCRDDAENPHDVF